jgi:hypothetical protein
MDVAYQVTWRGRDGTGTPARLRLGPDGLRLDPLEDGGSHEVSFEGIVGVELDPSGEGASGIALVLAGGERVELASNVKRWILSDLLAALFAHRFGTHTDRRRVLVRAGLKPGCSDEARRLLQVGPPFDPSSSALVLHEAFVFDDEVLFLFETNGESALLSLARPDFWQAAGAWNDLIEGGIRLIEPVYSWAREARPAFAEAHPGLGL